MSQGSFFYIAMKLDKISLSFLCVALIFGLYACHSRSGNEKQSYNAQILFEDSVHDFGILPFEDARQAYVFRFTNVGESPAVILNVAPGCKCITVEYSRSVIRKGEQGYVKVTYDGTTGSAGYFDKSIQVHINSLKAYVLRVKGNLEKP